MALYTIADLHLPLGVEKPMDVFGKSWENYVKRLCDNWQSLVKDDDTVIIPGDFSWATYLEESYKDFDFLNSLNGKKILLKGNHDYWWTTKNKLDKFIKENNFENIEFLHNNSYVCEEIGICGTRGWLHPAWESFSITDKKIFQREVIRLELSLQSMTKCEQIYVFTHFPPISLQRENNEFRIMLKKYNVKKCFYGHLHSMSHKNAFCGVAEDGIEYSLVSADYLNFIPMKIKG